MNWLTRNVKWVAGVATVLAIVASAQMAEAGRRWSGIDPRLDINGHQLNIRVEWETEHTCDINGPINVRVLVPTGSIYKFMGESGQRFDCNGDGRFDTSLATNTTIIENAEIRRVWVSSNVGAREARFQTKLVLFKDNQKTDECMGISNKWFKCQGPRF